MELERVIMPILWFAIFYPVLLWIFARRLFNWKQILIAIFTFAVVMALFHLTPLDAKIKSLIHL